MKKFLILIFFIMINLSLAKSEEITIIGEKPIVIEADYLAYSFDDEIILATGDVNIVIGKIKITSDSLQIDLEERFLQTQGKVTMGEAEIIPSRSSYETGTPILSIDYPPDGLITTNSILQISGRILPGYNLYIDEKEVEIEITGKFTHQVILNPGENLITFLAIDENGNKTEVLRKVNYTTSSVSLFQGDALKLDLSSWQGCLFRVGAKIEKIYFEGESLKLISQSFIDLSQDIQLPDITSAGLAVVAKRMRIVFGESFEAWNVTFYTKGVKSISIPYYTSSVETTFAEIPFQITGINYSSKQHFNISSRVHYLRKEKNQGFLNLNYISKYQTLQRKTGEKWSCDLEQHFALAERKTGTIYFYHLGEPNWNMSLTYQHFFNRTLEGSLNTSFSPDEYSSNSLSLRKRYALSDVNFSFSYSKTLSSIKGSNLTSLISYQSRPQNLEGTRIAYTCGLSAKNYKTTKPDFEDWEGEFRLNIFKSGISLLPWSFLDLRTSYTTLLSLKGIQSTSYGINSALNFKFENVYLNINHSISEYQATSIQGVKSKSFTRGLSGATSFGRKIYWNCRFSTNYDLNKKEFRDISSGTDVRLNRLVRSNVVSYYNFQINSWTDVTITVLYSIFGERSKRRLQGVWYYKRKEYFISLSSMI